MRSNQPKGSGSEIRIFIRLQHLLLALLSTLPLLGSNAQANLGDTEVQSATRYGNAFYTTTIPSGTLRLYHTLDHKYLVQQLFTHGEIVETICYIKMGNAAYTPLPMTQSETDQLRDANIPADTIFPATTVSLEKAVEHEKVWRSDNGKYYIDIGSMSAKDSPFGVPLDCVVFATSAGYGNLQILMNKAEADQSQTAQTQ
jgi:hypothetical protein